MTFRPSRALESESRSFSAASWPSRCSGSKGRLDDLQPVGLRRASVTEPLDRQGPVSVSRWALRSRPLAGACAQRGLSRPADGGPDAGGVSSSGDPARAGRRQRASDQGRSSLPRSAARLQSPALDPAADVPEERPARAAAGEPGTGRATGLHAARRSTQRGRSQPGHRPGASSVRNRDRAWDCSIPAAVPSTARGSPPGSRHHARRPRIPESVGQPVPRAWAQSLPLGVAGPAWAFDEFSPAEQTAQASSLESAAVTPTLFRSTTDPAAPFVARTGSR